MSDEPKAFPPKKGTHLYSGIDALGRPGSIGYGPTPDIAETRARDSAARLLREQPHRGPLKKWKFIREGTVDEQG